MTYDPDRHATLLADYCVAAQPGDRVLVSADPGDPSNVRAWATYSGLLPHL